MVEVIGKSLRKLGLCAVLDIIFTKFPEGMNAKKIQKAYPRSNPNVWTLRRLLNDLRNLVYQDQLG